MKLCDDDIKDKTTTPARAEGTGNSYDFGARIYDPRVGRFLSLDPLMNKFPWQSPFVFANNNPIELIDLHGKQGVIPEVLPEIDPKEAVEPVNESTPEFYQIDIFGASEEYIVTTPELYNYGRGNPKQAQNTGGGTSLGNNGAWNATSTSPFQNSIGNAFCLNLRLNKTIFKDRPEEMKLNNVGVNVSNNEYVPTQNKDGVIISYLQEIYDANLNAYIQQKLKENPSNDPNKRNLIVTLATTSFAMKNGTSPMSQFETQAKEAIKNGTILKTGSSNVLMFQQVKPDAHFDLNEFTKKYLKFINGTK